MSTQSQANGSVAERSSDFAVGDIVLLTAKRKGTIKYIGNIDGIGSQIFGIELKDGSKSNGNSQDGSYGGKKYFDCEPGRGTFVTRSKISTRIKAVGENKDSKDKITVNKKRKNGKRKPKSPRPTGRTVGRSNTGLRSPRPASSANATTRGRKNGKNKTPKKKTSSTPKATESFDIPEDATLEAKIDFILEKLKDTKSQFKGRQKMLKTLNDIFENEEKMDEELIKKTIDEFRKPFQMQLNGKRVTIHKAVMETLTIIAKTKKDIFSPLSAFYVKKLVGHCKHTDPKSVQTAEKTLQFLIKESNNKFVIAATLIQAATHAKNKLIRKHAWQYLNETLKYCLPVKGQTVEPPPKDILDALTVSLKSGLAESDRHTKDEAMHVLNTLGLFDETRAEKLISKMPQTQQRTYQKKFDAKGPSNKRANSARSAGSAAGKKPKTDRPSRKTDKKPGSQRKSSKDPKRKPNSKTVTPKKPNGTKPVSKKPLKTDTTKANGKKPNVNTKASDSNVKEKGNKDKPNDEKSNEKSETNGTVIIENGNSNESNKNNEGNNNNDKKEESEENDDSNTNVVKKKTRQRNANSLMGTAEDEQISQALGIDLPGDDEPSGSDTSDVASPRSAGGGILSPEDETQVAIGDNDNDEEENQTKDKDKDMAGDDDDEDRSTTSTSTEPDDHNNDPNTAIELIESFLELKDPQINWKMIEFLSKDNMTHLLMSYISRMPGGPKIWTENLDVDFDMVIPPTKPLSSEEESEIRATRLSYSLMRILSNEHAAETVKSFLLRKCQEICLHALAVFHPRSKGNVYHGRVVLEILLNDWPKSFMGALANQKHIQKLLKCALFRNLHQGNLNSFFLDLICYRPNPKTAQLQPIKRKLLKLFSDWQFMEYLLDAACSPKHGDDVATKYATFFIDLVARSASIPEAAELFHGHEHLIIDSFMNALLDDDQNRTLWHRIICGQTLVQFLDISSRPNIMDPAAAMSGVMGIVPEPSPNVLHLMFDKSLERLHTFIPRMCNAIQNPKEKLEAITLSGGIVERPFGQVRLNCLELLTVSADFAQFGCGKVLGKLTNSFWKSILDMAFIHETNNMYLCHFRRLIHLSMIFRRRFLKYLFVKCNMLERLIEFYQTPNKNRSTLHGYILQMLWDIYHHDQRDDEEQKQESNDIAKDDDNGSNSSVIVNDDDTSNTNSNDKPTDKDNNNDNKNNTNDLKDTSEKPEINGNGSNDENNNNNNNNNDDSNEDKKNEDEFTEEDLILRPNFSRDQEDQWDIVSFFKNNESWKTFEPILTNQIEIQNNADTQLPNPNVGGDGQLDALLQNLLGSSTGMGDDDNENDDDDDDSSSDDSSDDE